MVDLVTYRFRVGNYTQKQFNFRSGCSSMTGSDKNSRAFTLMCILAIGMLVNKVVKGYTLFYLSLNIYELQLQFLSSKLIKIK